MSTIHVNGQYEGEDYQSLIEAEHGFQIEWAAFPIGLSVMSAFWIWTGEARFGLLAVMIACGGWVCWLWKRNRLGVRQAIDAAVRTDRAIDITIDDSGLRYCTANSIHEFRWQAFDDFSESRLLVLLQSGRTTHVWIPKRLMSPEVLDQLRERLVRTFRPTELQANLRAFPVVQPAEPTHD